MQRFAPYPKQRNKKSEFSKEKCVYGADPFSCRHELAELPELLRLEQLGGSKELTRSVSTQSLGEQRQGHHLKAHGQYGHPRRCAPLWRWRVSCGSQRPCPLVPESERCARPLQYCAQTPFFWHAAVKPVRQWADWPSCLCQVTPGVRRSASINKSCGRKMLCAHLHAQTHTILPLLVRLSCCISMLLLEKPLPDGQGCCGNLEGRHLGWLLSQLLARAQLSASDDQAIEKPYKKILMRGHQTVKMYRNVSELVVGVANDKHTWPVACTNLSNHFRSSSTSICCVQRVRLRAAGRRLISLAA